MTTCTAEAIRWAIGKKIKTINLSTGRDQSKTRWRLIDVTLCEGQWGSPSLRAPWLYRAAKTVSYWGRQVAKIPGPDRWLVRVLTRRRE
jgi:hypothetical protein